MENLPFVIWTLLFPVCMNLSDYYGAKEKAIKNQPHKEYADDTNRWANLIFVATWIFVAFKLYQ